MNRSIIATVLVALLMMVAPVIHAGTIFLTDFEGTAVEGTVIFEVKDDVHGGNGPNPGAPGDAAGWDPGVYVFMITNPAGSEFYSTDPWEARLAIVGEGRYFTGTVPYFVDMEVGKGKNATIESVDISHRVFPDLSHNGEGAVVIQLNGVFPEFEFLDTTNPGGVYKVWFCKIEDFDPEMGPGTVFGFPKNNNSRTKNFKVKEQGPKFFPAEVDVIKVIDWNGNGKWDDGEPEVGVDVFIDELGNIVDENGQGTGWIVDVTDPLDMMNQEFTPLSLVAEPPGLWTFEETLLDGWAHTGTIVDGVPVDLENTENPHIVDLNIIGFDGEYHSIVYLNVPKMKFKACKLFGYSFEDNIPDVPLAGWVVRFQGTNLLGEEVDRYFVTGDDGCVEWEELPALNGGDYLISEVFPLVGDWQAASDTSFFVSGASQELQEVTFLNYCTYMTTQVTRGWWQNNNGQADLIGRQDCIDRLGTFSMFQSGYLYTAQGVLVTMPIDDRFELADFIVAPNSEENRKTYKRVNYAQHAATFMLSNCVYNDVNDILLTSTGAFLASDIEFDLNYLYDHNGKGPKTGLSRRDLKILVVGINESHGTEAVSGEPCEVDYTGVDIPEPEMGL